MKTVPKPDTSTLEPMPGGKAWEVHSPKKWCLQEKIEIPAEFEGRVGKLTIESDEYWLTFPATAEDKRKTYEGWTKPTRTKYAKRVWQLPYEQRIDPEAYKRFVRVCIDEEGNDAGIYVWIPAVEKYLKKSVTATSNILLDIGFDKSEVQPFLGNREQHPTIIKNIPFADEYPARGVWNRQKSWQPHVKSVEGPTPNIDAALQHLGQAFDSGVSDNPKLAEVGIETGYDYLMTKLSWAVQRPEDSLPYTVLYSKGKKHGKDFVRDLFIEMLDKSVLFLGESREVRWPMLHGRANTLVTEAVFEAGR